MKELFYWTGAMAIAGICLILVFLVIHFVYDELLELRHRISYKKRFNKKPIAKCYCVDCKQWNPETGECYDPCNSRHMGPSWFCCFAEPISKEQAEKRKEIIKEKW